MPYYEGQVALRHWQSSPAPIALQAVGTSNGTFVVTPLDGQDLAFPGNMVANTFAFGVSYSWTSTSVSQSFASSYRLGLYTRSISTLSLVNSASGTFGATTSTTGNSSLFNGFRYLSIGTGAWSTSPNLVAGQRYYLAVQFLSAVTTTSMSFVNGWSVESSFSGGLYTAGAPNASNMPFAPFRGIFTATTTAVPVTIEASQMTGTGSVLSLFPFIRIDDDFKNWIG